MKHAKLDAAPTLFKTTFQVCAKSADIANIACDALVVGVYASEAKDAKDAKKGNKSVLSAAAAALQALNCFGNAASLADLPTGAGKTHTVYPPADASLKAQRVICVGLGKASEYSPKVLQKALNAALSDAKGYARVVIALDMVKKDMAGKNSAEKNSAEQFAQLSLIAAHEACYQYDATKSKKADANALSEIVFAYENAAQKKALTQGAAQGNAIGAGMNVTRELANLPANICTPTFLANHAQNLAARAKKDAVPLSTEVLEHKQMQALGMGSLLSVTAGSDEPPRFIVMKYLGAKAVKTRPAPIVLVGKGVTFDTGGISLKPGLNMDEMKYDMCGAASVLGVMNALVILQPEQDVIGVVAAVENMPSGRATKPGDVVTSMSGQTIEVLNTDAEGRLILCDALTYVERFKPAAVIDIATLTGACVVALGAVNSGLFSSDDALANAVLAAGKAALDPAWRMPMDEEYHDQLKSNFADMGNIGGMPAGSVTAACFLSKFTKAYPWAHLDIAGTAWKSGAAKGATARPVPLLMEYVLNQSKLV